MLKHNMGAALRARNYHTQAREIRLCIRTHKELPTLEGIKRALVQTTAYGFACPAQIQYFYSPDRPRPGYMEDWSWINKPEHRAIWGMYEPANLAICLAGWEPVTYAFMDTLNK